MDTPKRCGGWIVAFALSWAALCSTAETRAEAAQPLTIEAQMGGAWVRVLGTDRKHLIGGDAARPSEIPDAAPLRLVGDLAANTDYLDASATFDLVSLAQPSESAQPPKFEARDIGFPYHHAVAGADPESTWLLAQPEQAVAICIWQLDGKPSLIRAQKLIQNGKDCFSTTALTLDLAAAETRGNPVFLLLAEGKVLPKRPLWSNVAADRTAVLAALGQDATAAKLIAQHGTLPKPAKGKSHLLHLCAQAGATETVAALLRLKAPLAAANEHGNTALHLAARCGRTEVVEQLLAAQAPKDAGNNRKDTPLHLAAKNAQSETCRLLVEAGAPERAKNDSGQNPLLFALLGNDLPTIERLLARKGSFDFVEGGLERALIAKSAQGQREIVRLLLAQRANVNEVWRDQTALIAASREGYVGVATDLLAAKADPNRANKSGITPLLAAASRGRAPVVQLLLAAGAQPAGSGKNKTSPLAAACFAGSGPSVKELLAAGALADQVDGRNIRPLAYAVAAGSREAVDLLLASGAKVDPTSPRFDSELASALSLDADAYLAAALQSGMPPTYRTAKGWSALQIATLSKAENCAALLRAAGANDLDTLSATTVVSASDLEKRPQLLELHPPFDPRSPEESDLRGEMVIVEATIDKDGTAAFARATCQDCRLSQSAVQTVLRSRFAPALKDGIPVATQVRIPVKFPDFSELKFEPRSLDVMPQIVKTVPPIYPFDLKRAGATGVVTVEFFVEKDGSVQEVKVIGSAHPLFSASAVAAIKQWRFKPGMLDGKPVTTRTQQTFPFDIK